MTDYFGVLRQPRRLWLNLDELEENYRELARSTHPDETGGQEGTRFAEVNTAYRTLRDPKLRLHHLLTLEGKPPSPSTADIPAELIDLFMKIAPALRNSVQEEINGLNQQLTAAYNEALEHLNRLNGSWREHGLLPLNDAENLYHRLAFLSRWKDLLAEHQFDLSTNT